MFLQNTRAIVRLSWPILVAQVAILLNGLADTVMAGHYSSLHLAAIGIGAGIYATVFFSLLGILQGLTPLIARNFGANNFKEIGALVRQGFWVALFLSAVGMAILSFPGWILDLAKVPASIKHISEAYLRVTAFGLPGIMLARIFYVLTPAVHKPRPVMLINGCTLIIKIPLSYILMYGKFGFPELGGVGCAIGSVVMFWGMFLFTFLFLKFDAYYHQFIIWGGSWRLSWKLLKSIFYLGIPIALSQIVEITSFTFMALFLAPLGPIISAANQIISNLAVLLFMIPLSLGLGTQILVSQALGERDAIKARANAFAGIRIAFIVSILAVSAIIFFNTSLLALYTSDQAVLLLTSKLLPLLALYHLCDVIQGLAMNALRGYGRIVFSTVIYIISLWGIGLGFGWWLTFKGLFISDINLSITPQGVNGMWIAADLSLVVAGLFLLMYLLYVSRKAIKAH